MTGKPISIRIRSGIAFAATVTPSAPSTATTISKPRRCKRRINMSRLSSLSSTRRILAIGFLLLGGLRNAGCDQRTDFSEEVFLLIRALLQDARYLPTQALAFLRGEVH